jgi:RNA polymerase sigma-70 factor (ECF subfamily)
MLTAVATSAAQQTSVGFEACYAEHRHRVYRWALRFGLGSAPWAEDLTHDVFVRLMEHLDELDPDDLGAWLYTVTANLAFTRIRGEQSTLARLVRFFSPPPAQPPPDETLERDDEARAALEALGRLPARERVVMSMKYLEGRSQQEIAESLSLSKGYVSKIVDRATQRLRMRGWEMPHAA